MQINALCQQHPANAVFYLVSLVRIEVGESMAGHKYPGHVGPQRDRITAEPEVIAVRRLFPVADMRQRGNRQQLVRLDTEQRKAQMISRRNSQVTGPALRQ